MRFYELKSENDLAMSNSFVLDTEDGVVEFTTKDDINHLSGFMVKSKRISCVDKYGDIYAKLLMMGNNLFLYGDSRAVLTIDFDNAFGVWNLRMKVNKNYAKSVSSIKYEYTDRIFKWSNSDSNIDSGVYYAVIPEYYLCHLLSDRGRLESEMKKILNHTCFLVEDLCGNLILDDNVFNILFNE